MTRYRPPSTVKDGNHYIPRDYLRDRCGGFEVVRFGRTLSYCANYQGYGFKLHDMSNYGGVYPDWMLVCGRRFCWVEVKTEEAYKKPDHDLKPGEKWLQDNSEVFNIVVTDNDFENVLQKLIEVQSNPERQAI